MIVPGVRRRAPHLPHVFVPFGLAVAAISLTLLGWALFAPSQVGVEPMAAPGPDITSIRSFAYTVPGPQFDHLMIQRAAGGVPELLARFPHGGVTGFHAIGAASPMGDEIAILWLPAFATRANLSLVNVASREVRQVEGTFDPLAPLAWSPDGRKLALTSTVDLDGTATSVVFEVDLSGLRTLPVAEFKDALEVVPVGYSFESQRLFIVRVDSSGSNLFVERDAKSEFVAELSPGRTRDWALSPDGARLAFVDILGGGSRTHVGRTMVLATGAITTLPAEKNQVGATWMPGSSVPGFGGPGGAWQLTNPAPDAAYIVPGAWSPDASYLIATVYSATDDRGSRPSTALELITRETSQAESTRQRITEVAGAAFFGWVHDAD